MQRWTLTAAFLAWAAGAATSDLPTAPRGAPLEVLHVAVVPSSPVTGEPLTLLVTYVADRDTVGASAETVMTISIERQGEILARSQPEPVEALPGQVGHARKRLNVSAAGRFEVRVQLASGELTAERLVPLEVLPAVWVADGEGGAGGSRTAAPSHPPPGSSLAPLRVAGVDCAALEKSFVVALAGGASAEAARTLDSGAGCEWYGDAAIRLARSRRSDHEARCISFDIDALSAISRGDMQAAQQLIEQGMQSGCPVSAGVRQALQRRLDLKETEAQRPPSKGPSESDQIDIWRRLSFLAAWGQSVGPAGMAGPPPGGWSNPGAVPYLPPVATPDTGGGAPGPAGAGTEMDEQRCREIHCPVCETNLNLLGVSVSPECESCLGASADAIRGCTQGGGPAAGASSAGALPGAQGESGTCYVASTWSDPVRYAAACDGNDGPAVWKLASAGHFVVVLGPTTWDSCQRFIAAQGQAGW